MTWPTHILGGLIVGKLTGNYTAAMAGSLVIDLDHVVSYYKHGLLSHPRQILHASKNETDPWGNQRNFLHSIFSWLIVSGLLFATSAPWGLAFSLAYLVHLIFDALDGADFWPLFPIKSVVTRGPIKYNSRQEIILDVCLLAIFVALFVAV